MRSTLGTEDSLSLALRPRRATAAGHKVAPPWLGLTHQNRPALSLVGGWAFSPWLRRLCRCFAGLKMKHDLGQNVDLQEPARLAPNRVAPAHPKTAEGEAAFSTTGGPTTISSKVVLMVQVTSRSKRSG